MKSIKAQYGQIVLYSCLFLCVCLVFAKEDEIDSYDCRLFFYDPLCKEAIVKRFWSLEEQSRFRKPPIPGFYNKVEKVRNPTSFKQRKFRFGEYKPWIID